jgi:hypothetical protein
MEEFSHVWFEESSNQWMKNKRKLKHCHYVYICKFIDMSGKRCKNQVKFTNNQSCTVHYLKLMEDI